MTAITAQYTNQVLQGAGIQLRVRDKGLAKLLQTTLFPKALHHCQKNAKARDDILTLLAHYKDDPSLVYVDQNNGQSQFLDAQPTAQAQSMDNPPPRRTAPTQTPPAQQSAPASRPAQPAPAQDTVPAADHPNAPSQAQPSHNAGGESDPNDGKREFIGHHVYGNKAALYFGCDDTRAGSETIAVDGAMSVAPRKFDWSKKLRIQITRADLPTVAAVFFGLLPKVELSNYGADNTKRLSVENQGKNYFLNMTAKGYSQIAVPISASDVFEIRSLFLRQLLANRPEIGVEGILANLKCHAAMLKAG